MKMLRHESGPGHFGHYTSKMHRAQAASYLFHSLSNTIATAAMATTLRAFLTFFTEESIVEEGNHHPRAAEADENSFISTSSLVYKMYKRVVDHAAADETSSEMTLDCSSLSEHEYFYDLDDEEFLFNYEDGSFGVGGAFKQGK